VPEDKPADQGSPGKNGVAVVLIDKCAVHVKLSFGLYIVECVEKLC